MRHVNLVQLYEDNREKLLLNWHIGQNADRRIEIKGSNSYGADLVGHINIIHPERLQVLGLAEYDWAMRIGERRFGQMFADLLSAKPPAVIVADGLTPPPMVAETCAQSGTPLIFSPKPCSAVIDLIRIYLSARLADTISMHGVFMDVLGMGVLITGDSGVGKSELALELISRGHGLVADDVVEMARIAPTTIEGRCPGMLRDFLEVRGLGLLNIRTIFGETAVRPKKVLKLIIHLMKANDQAMQTLDRLNIQSETQDILGVTVRKVILPVAAGRNLAVLVEAAVRNYILQLRGIDSTREFIDRHTNLLRDQEHAADSD